MSHVRPVFAWLGKRLKLRNVRVPLTNNEQIRVGPRESTSNPKAGHALGSASSVSTGFGLPRHLIWVRALAGQGWTNRETMSPLARGVLKNICQELPDRYTHTGSNGKSAWATTRNV